ncbi:MAG: hypothetical protein M3R68_07200, partial [Acidobacteriota bacterium]|nr:hypothetical protein [Acidobacteriota bacterium]
MNHQKSLLVIVLTTLFSSTILQGQTLDPAYLSDMPAPARIVNEIKGKDAEDTGERQMGAFMSLVDLMDEMAWGLGHRYVNNADTRRLTPDERRIRLAYQTAYADLWHKVTNKEGHVYDHDRDLRNELLNKFFSQTFRDLYFKSNANAAAAYKAFQDKMYSTGTTTATGQPSGQGVAPGSTAELRRCIASGRSMRTCFSEVMGNGFDQMIGISLKPTIPPGLRMTGDYSTAGGFRLIFQPDKVTMVCRNVPAPRPYTVEVSDTQTSVTIQNESRPVVFSLRPDGKLSASGPIRVTGQIPAKLTTTYQFDGKDIYPIAKNIEYVNKTADCTLGLMTPTGPTPLPPDIESPFGILSAIGGGMGELMKGGDLNAATKEMLSPGKAVLPGPRMSGTYTGENGFSLAFHAESVTVGCGDVERALEYSVQRSASHMMVQIRDDNPISLQLKTDGSIVGEGSVQVNGRVITGTTDDVNNPFVFAPHVARCPVGRLVAGGTPANTSSATSTSASANTPTATSASASPTSLSIKSGPNVAN